MLEGIVQLLFVAIASAVIWSSYRNSTFSVHERCSTFWPRFWAPVVDSLVLWPFSFACTTLAGLTDSGPARIGFVFADAMIWFGYVVGMHARHGQTLGKRVCQVRILTFKDESPITFRQALLRESIPMLINTAFLVYSIVNSSTVESESDPQLPGAAFWILSAMTLLWFALECVTMLTNDKRRALHDFIAGTVVVRTNAG